jgi:hypothetical protein
MKTIETDTASAEAIADLEYALKLLEDGKRDLDFEKKMRAKGDKIRREILVEHGILNVAVDLIREGRDEE